MIRALRAARRSAMKARTQAANQLQGLRVTAPEDLRRYQALSAEIAELDAQLDRLVRQVAPQLVCLAGIGTDHAATLLIVAGDNPERLRSEASFASVCGVSPVEASSGKVVRHRLNLM
jgi:transposase